MFKFKAIYIVYLYTTLFYILTPAYIYLFYSSSELYSILIKVVLISNVMLFFGYNIAYFTPILRIKKICINPVYFYNSIFVLFVLFVIYSFYSIGGVPFFQVLFNSYDADLARGELFKGRSGYQVVLLYASAIFTYVFVPLAVVMSFEWKFNSRKLFLIVSLFFCIATLQKALLLNILLPLIVLFFIQRKLRIVSLIKWAILLMAYFVVMITFTGSGRTIDKSEFDLLEFFSSSFSPSGGLEYFFWRVIAVPLYTAVDTLYVFYNDLGGVNTLGGTSKLFSMILGVPHVELEKLVFAYQFGGYNPLANANTNFSVVLFVDFNYLGLIVFSFLLGVIFRVLERSKETVIVCLGYLLAFKVLNAPLIGLFFSAGFLYVIFHALFLRFRVQGTWFEKH
jgi:hypothetical protein